MLGSRQELILAAVVEEYIRTAAPVGSRTVVKKGLKLSPATARSEMGKLESAGLLEQPHTSAGRKPTDRGFRYYVERLIRGNWPSLGDREEFESLGDSDRGGARDLIAGAAALLSRLSHRVGLVMVMPIERSRLRSVHFVGHGMGRIRAVFHLMGGGREERVIENNWGLDAGSLNKLSNLVNRVAPGLTLVELRRELIGRMEEAKARADQLLARAVELSEELVKDRRPMIYIRGQSNLFDLPEFSEMSTVREMVRTLEEQNLLVEVLEEVSLASGVRVIIGEENKVEPMKRYTVIASAYGRGEMTVGALGVMGPTRMDYARLIPLVHYASDMVSERLSR